MKQEARRALAEFQILPGAGPNHLSSPLKSGDEGSCPSVKTAVPAPGIHLGGDEMEPVVETWFLWRWKGDQKTPLNRSYLQEITHGGKVFETTDHDLWSNYPTRLLRSEIEVLP
jgi:hypothetical protein